MINYDRTNPNDEYFGNQNNTTGIQPVGYKILVEIPVPHDLQHAENEGLVIPETAKERYTNAAVAAKVVELGKECYTHDKFPSGPWVKPGDWIVMSPYSGTRIKSILNTGVDFRFINDDSVEGIVPGPDFVERGK